MTWVKFQLLFPKWYLKKIQFWGAQGPKIFVEEWSCINNESKGSLAHLPAHSYNTICCSSFTRHAIVTKILHLLWEKKTLLKNSEWTWMNFIYRGWWIYNWWSWLGLEKKPKRKSKIEQKENLFGYPPILQSMIWRPTVFQCPWGLKTSRTFSNGGGKLS